MAEKDKKGMLAKLRERISIPTSGLQDLAARWFRFSGVVVVLITAFLAMFSAHYSRLANDSLVDSPFLRDLASAPIIIERQFYDKRSRFLYESNPVDKDIVMLMIDDPSLQEIGRWPWSRSVWTTVLDRLGHFGAKVVAFDVLFPEEEKACSGPSPDKEFAAAIERFQKKNNGAVVLAYTLTNDPTEALPEIPMALYLSSVTGQAKGIVSSILPYIYQSTFPIESILSSTPLLGSIEALPSSDGVYRDYALVGIFDGNIFPSLALSAFTSYFKRGPKDEITYREDTSTIQGALEIKREEDKNYWSLPLNSKGEVRVRFHGAETKFKNISIKNFLNSSLENEEMKQAFAGKMVFIGSSAIGAHDLRHTPVNAVLPGVYLHSNAFHMLANQKSFKDQDLSFFWSIGLLVCGAIVLLLFMQLSSPLAHVLGLSLALLTIFLIDQNYLLPQGFTPSLFFIILGLFLSYSWVTIFDFIRMAKERKRVREAFTRYVAPDIVKEMLTRPELLRVGGVKKEVSMIFSDIRDFTSMSEKLNPQDLANLLNKYMGRMTDILFDSKGTLDKYIGDAIVGFWNAPIDVKNHPYHAVRGALEMVEALPAINRTFRQLRYPQISVGIGINTGEVSVGNMGSDRIFSYTALGDHMNLASRLEGLTKYYGAKLLISEFTYNAVSEEERAEFVFRQVDLVRVKGRRQAVKIFEVLQTNHEFRVNMDALQEYNEGYSLYLDKKFEESYSKFNALSKRFPEDKPTQRIKSNCVEYISSPPDENWDGVTTFTTK